MSKCATSATFVADQNDREAGIQAGSCAASYRQAENTFPAASHVLGSVALLNVLGCRLTCYGQAETNAEAWFNIALRPRKPEGSLGRTAQDGHLDSHTAPDLS